MFRKRILLFSVMPFLFASKCKERQKEKDKDEIIDVIHPASELQVLGIDPGTMEAGVSFPAAVTGTGFLEGATVMIGMQTLVDAEWISGNQLSISVPALSPGDYDIEVENPNGQKHILQAGLWIQDPDEMAKNNEAKCENLTVYFDLDKSTITDESQQELETRKDCLSLSSIRIRVEGHCDERGTTEYNIALGQRRANAVERYLIGSGVVPSMIETVSYGEEKPVVQGSNPDAWKQNRRAEIIFSQ